MDVLIEAAKFVETVLIFSPQAPFSHQNLFFCSYTPTP